MDLGDRCFLLTEEQPDPMPVGWTAEYFGNWAEPDQCQNGNIPLYQCYEKVAATEGVFAIHAIITKINSFYSKTSL